MRTCSETKASPLLAADLFFMAKVQASQDSRQDQSYYAAWVQCARASPFHDEISEGLQIG